MDRIERALDAGSYRPGPWSAFLRAARRRPRAERVALAPDVSRVSDKLHRSRHARRLPFWMGLTFEGVGTALGVVLLQTGLARGSSALVVLAASILAVTLQPLLKLAVGGLVGVRYSHFFFFGIEPRFKMRYGTYLAANRCGRVLLHLSGTVGSPLAVGWVAARADGVVPRASAICDLLFVALVAIQVVTFLLGFAGVRLGRLGLARQTSGGAAAHELRESLRS